MTSVPKISTHLLVSLLAVLALATALSSTASAANYTAGSYPTTATGESARGNDVFTTEGGKVECSSHYKGTLSAASSTLTVVPTYTNCRAFGFLEASVSMNGCDYLFKSPTGSSDSYTAAVAIKCTAPVGIIITAATCQVNLGEQSPTGSVAITNETAAGDIKVKANVTGIEYDVLQDGFGCPFSGTGLKTGGTYVQGNAVTFDSTNGAKVDVG